MTGEPAKNFHGVGIGPLSKILAVKSKMKSEKPTRFAMNQKAFVCA